MAHLNITIEGQTLKEFKLGGRDEAVFNAALSAEAIE